MNVRLFSRLVNTQAIPSCGPSFPEYGRTSSSFRTPFGAASTGIPCPWVYRSTHSRYAAVRPCSTFGSMQSIPTTSWKKWTSWPGRCSPVRYPCRTIRSRQVERNWTRSPKSSDNRSTGLPPSAIDPGLNTLDHRSVGSPVDSLSGFQVHLASFDDRRSADPGRPEARADVRTAFVSTAAVDSGRHPCDQRLRWETAAGGAQDSHSARPVPSGPHQAAGCHPHGVRGHRWWLQQRPQPAADFGTDHGSR